jgi:hypothetical protein
MIVGVVPDPASTWLGFTIPEFRYLAFHWTRGLPPRRAQKRYIRLSVTM